MSTTDGELTCPSSLAESENEDLAEYNFYFESDHLPLRENNDYRAVLRTLALLEVQRTYVLKNLKDLYKVKAHYLKNPNELLQKLKQGEQVVQTHRIDVAELPIIRNCNGPSMDIKPEQSENSAVKVRGRIMNETKSSTFNQLWTYEEQRRLEQLLTEYPPEAIESHRYAKIAKALGNRTTQQVTSRCQKYFQKLSDAGLPIPGRKPRSRRTIQTKLKRFYRPTTFFPHFRVPHFMDEDETSNDSFQNQSSESNIKQENQSEQDIDMADSEMLESDKNFHDDSEKVKSLRKERIINMLEIIRKEKQEFLGYHTDLMGPNCEVCTTERTMQHRWYCHTCAGIIYRCANCLVDEIVNETFPHLHHNFVLHTEF